MGERDRQTVLASSLRMQKAATLMKRSSFLVPRIIMFPRGAAAAEKALPEKSPINKEETSMRKLSLSLSHPA